MLGLRCSWKAAGSTVDYFQARFLSNPPKGQVAKKVPVKMNCEAGKTYNWCACGLSSKQPLCDGSHQRSPIGLKPVAFVAPQTKEYIFCQCKQTNKQPLCDGSHKRL